MGVEPRKPTEDPSSEVGTLVCGLRVNVWPSPWSSPSGRGELFCWVELLWWQVCFRSLRSVFTPVETREGISVVAGHARLRSLQQGRYVGRFVGGGLPRHPSGFLAMTGGGLGEVGEDLFADEDCGWSVDERG